MKEELLGKDRIIVIYGTVFLCSKEACSKNILLILNGGILVGKIKTRHLVFSYIYYLIGTTFLNLLDILFPETSFLKTIITFVVGYILLYSLIRLWGSNLMNEKPSPFMWAASAIVLFLSLLLGYGIHEFFA